MRASLLKPEVTRGHKAKAEVSKTHAAVKHQRMARHHDCVALQGRGCYNFIFKTVRASTQKKGLQV